MHSYPKTSVNQFQTNQWELGCVLAPKFEKINEARNSPKNQPLLSPILQRLRTVKLQQHFKYNRFNYSYVYTFPCDWLRIAHGIPENIGEKLACNRSRTNHQVANGMDGWLLYTVIALLYFQPHLLLFLSQALASFGSSIQSSSFKMISTKVIKLQTNSC